VRSPRQHMIHPSGTTLHSDTSDVIPADSSLHGWAMLLLSFLQSSLW
jgi:hypothetical protein